MFWDPVYKASAQAALDMGVELFNEPFEPEQDETVLYNKMANRITALCEQQGVDGLFVSIPSDIVEPAIQTCLDLGIPVMSINAGAEASQRMGLAHHIGMIEDSAGYAAGVKLAATGIDKAVCINHAEGVNVVTERWYVMFIVNCLHVFLANRKAQLLTFHISISAGFKRAVEEKGITFIGEAFVPADDMNKYIEIVEEMVGETGDWTGYGLLAAGSPQHVPVLALQAKHTDVKIGSFDTSSELYEAVDIGIQEVRIYHCRSS